MLPIIISSIESPEDRDLMIAFYEEHQSRMYSEARKHLNQEEDVEDIVYEALTRIIEKIDTFRGLEPWQRVRYARTAVRNLAYIHLKRSRFFTMVSFDDIEYELASDYGMSAETVVEKQQFERYIRLVWKDLKQDDRMLLEQKYILHWKDAELAEAMGIQPQSVRMKLTRAKRNLFAELQKKGFHLSEWLPV